MYSAHVYTQSDMHGSIQYVIANGKTEKGMLSALKRYTSRLTLHHWLTPETEVYLHNPTYGQYDVKQIKDFI